MFAHAVDLNIFYHDHFTDRFMKLGRIYNSMCIGLITLCKDIALPWLTVRGFFAILPVSVFTQQS